MKTFIRSGAGFDVGTAFARAAQDLPCTLAPEENALPRHVIAYVAPDPLALVAAMQRASDKRGVRVHVLKSAIQEAN